MATEALYERILALMTRRELLESCNGVLGDELVAVQRAVAAVAAGFVRLQEVRDAVAQLEQDKGTVPSRSDSLMATVGETDELQLQLQQALAKVACGMAVHDVAAAPADKKRKRERHNSPKPAEKEEQTKMTKRKSTTKESGGGATETAQISAKCSSPSGESSTESEFKDKKAPVAKQQAAKGPKGMSDELKLAHECLRLRYIVKTNGQKIRPKKNRVWTKLNQSLVELIQQLAQCSDAKRQKTAAEVGALAVQGVANTLAKRKWTPKSAEEVKPLLSALTDACSKHEVLRTEFLRARAQLESVAMGIPRKIAKAAKAFKSAASSCNGTPERSTASSTAKKSNSRKAEQSFKRLILEVDTLSFDERTDCIPEVLRALQTAMAMDTEKRQGPAVTSGMKIVGKWVREVPCREHLLAKYRRFVGFVQDYAMQVPDKPVQQGLCRLSKSMGLLLQEQEQTCAIVGEAADDTAKQSDRRQTRSTATFHAATSTCSLNAQEAALQQSINDTLAQVREWQDGVFSLWQIDKAMKTIGQVFKATHTSEHKLQETSEVQECVDKLAACVLKIKKKEYREKRQLVLQGWATKYERAEGAVERLNKHHRL